MKITMRVITITIIFVVVLITSIGLVKYKLLTNRSITIYNPLNNALFPLDFAAPTFVWNDKSSKANSWKISLNFRNNGQFIKILTKTSWRPSKLEWDSIRKASENENIEIVIQRNDSTANSYFSVRGKSTIKISVDSVGAPILYRQIPLPFIEAEQHIELTCYSTYNVSNYDDPRHEVLERFPVCGNCHSSTADGKTIALDFDAVTRDKGGYFVARLDTQTVFDKSNYMSWSKMLGKSTFGLFSKISPTGRYIVTTVKDRVISEKFAEESKIAYSQLFVPVNGVLAVYDTQTKKFFELPGANDMKFVQTNAIWTPDEKNIIFARAKALPYPDKNSKYRSFIEERKTVEKFVKEEIDMKFDLCMIPFNEGKGGVAKLIEGASNNGKSNYFPAISHDGKWLVYCEAGNYMMLRPDSRLYILPMKGGKAKRMECNFADMNSWHSWSPNGKWLVFVSKAYSIYSDLLLTHIDENGNSSVPILLPRQKRDNCASNYPEFLNIDPNVLITMKYKYINLQDVRTAFYQKNIEGSKELLKEYLNQGLIGSPEEYKEIAELKSDLGEKEEAKRFREMAKKLELTFNRGY